jgi:hypothetical protein
MPTQQVPSVCLRGASVLKRQYRPSKRSLPRKTELPVHETQQRRPLRLRDCITSERDRPWGCRRREAQCKKVNS